MEWNQIIDDDKCVCFEADSTVLSLEDAKSDLVDFFIKMLEMFTANVIEGPVKVLISIWPDSGRIICHPIQKGKYDSSWPFAVQLTLESVLRLHGELPSPENPDFDFQIAKLFALIRIACTKAAKDSQVIKLSNTLKNIDLRTFFQECDDQDTRIEARLFLN